MTTTTPGRLVAADVADILKRSYTELRRYGTDSVRAAWRFGQCLDSFTDTYTNGMLAEAVGVSAATVAKYLKLHAAYQRPELAVDASRALQTYDIGIIIALRDDLSPVEHARPYAGRKYRYRCTHCNVVGEVKREEYDPDTGALIDRAGELMAVAS